MKTKPAPTKRPNQDVFINCPFDEGYLDIFRAIVFAVRACGYVPHTAKDESDAGRVRIEKILRLIQSCDWGIHDLSAVELDAATQTPRFNMPLELGISLGAQRLGGPRQRIKKLLILEREAHRYDASTSDISGQDIQAHGGHPEQAIKQVRDWLSDNRFPETAQLPGGIALANDYRRVRVEIDRLIAAGRLDPWETMTHRDYLGCLDASLVLIAGGTIS